MKRSKTSIVEVVVQTPGRVGVPPWLCCQKGNDWRKAGRRKMRQHQLMGLKQGRSRGSQAAAAAAQHPWDFPPFLQSTASLRRLLLLSTQSRHQ